MYNIATLITLTSAPQHSYTFVLLDKYSISFEAILLLTAISAAIFAIRSFRATSRANELSTVPHVFLDAEGAALKQRLILKNDNSKMAYSFHIENVEVLNMSEHTRDWQISKYSFKFNYKASNSRNFITSPSDVMRIDVFENGKPVEQHNEGFVTWLFRDRLKLKRGLWIYFRDSQNLKFFTIVDLRGDGVTHIKRAPTRYTLRWKVLKTYQNTSQFITLISWRLRIAAARLFT